MVQPSLPKSGRVTRGRRHHETKLTAEQRDEPLWCDQCFAQYFAEKKGQFQMKPPLFRPTGRGASQTEVSYSSSHDPPSDATRHVSIPARSMAKLVGIERRTAKSDEGTDACAFLTADQTANQRTAPCAHRHCQLVAMFLPESATARSVAIIVIDSAAATR